MAKSESRYVNLFDAHFGHELKGGHRKPLHDQHAIDATLAFCSDFKPTHLTFGGDMLDCGVISHWRTDKHRQVEGVRLLKEAFECQEKLLEPAAATIASGGVLRYHVGNHEQWLEDYVDANPQLEGLVELDALLGLTHSGWQLIPLGGASKIGKLYIVHGDQIGGGIHVAKKALDIYQRNIHFGHFHPASTHTAVAPLDAEPKQGMAVPGLCKRNPGYSKDGPNRWVQGFEYGFVEANGNFHARVVIMIDGRFYAEGKLYR
jgi:hypothetical protein